MLNIKNPRAHELAVEVATATGESLTAAVIHALEERLERVRPAKRDLDMEKIEGLLAQIRVMAPPSFFAEKDPTAFLYDEETGLPK